MPVLQTGQSFASGDQVTATKLQDIANLATFRTGANNTADGSTIEVDATGGYLKVPSNGIGTNQLSSDASVDANRAVGTNHIKDGAVTAAKLDSAAVSVLMPTATVLPYAGSTAPFGYLVCAGQSVLVADYGGLHGIIGYTYGGSGASFNLPDLRGRVIAGLDIDSGGLTNRLTTASAANLDGTVLGANNGNPGDAGRGTNGAQEHQLTESELPSHSHGYLRPNQIAVGAQGAVGSGYIDGAPSGLTDATGLDQAHNNVQPTIILNYIIKT
jgi:microcystin-dependent protein